MRRLLRPFEMFFRHESAGGIALLITAVIAMFWANSPWAGVYDAVFEMHFTIGLDQYSLTEPLRLWINDALMAIFFFVVGLEIKRELTVGELSSVRGAALPVAGALGGMTLPAIIFLLFNFGTENMRGWAIPTATDIAFALGVIRLFGSRVPRCAVIFLTALAIVDDIGAVAIIALLYTAELNMVAFYAALIVGVIIYFMNRLKISALHPYFLAGIVLWIAFFHAGIHPTIAGVALGMLIPGRHRRPHHQSPLHKAEKLLLPWVTFVIMPVFALANAGIPVNLKVINDLFSAPLALGIIGGLLIGKQLGIFLFSLAAVKLKIATLPQGSSWKDIYGTAIIGGIGFTMSVFISDLALTASTSLAMAKLSVILGSLLSGIIGVVYILVSTRNRERQVEIECEC